MNSILQYLHASITMRQQLNQSHNLKYLCIEDFVLQHGRAYTKIPRPAEIKQMMMRQCYANSLKLAGRRRSLTYCEGYATSIIPILHAWCIDRDGNVIDPTWDDEYAEYYGIPFQIDYVRAQLKQNKHYGVLDDWKSGYPLLAGLDKGIWYATS